MRTIGLLIKTIAFIILITVAVLSTLTGLKPLAIFSIFLMAVLFVMQSAEIFLGVN